MMEYSAGGVAIAIALISNCVAVIFLIFMLFRILNETQSGHRLVREGSEDLIKAGQQLTAMVESADAMIVRLRGATATLGEGGFNSAVNARSGSLMISPEGIKALGRLMQSLSKETVQEMEVVLAEMRRLLASLNAISPDNYPAWRQTNQPTIDRILAVPGLSTTNFIEIKSSLEESEVLTRELVRAGNEVAGKTLTQEELQAYMEQQEILLNNARDRAKNAEERAEMLNQQLNAMSEIDTARKSETQEIERLRAQNNQLSHERSSLVRHLETLTSEIKRTKLEKEFIEERLLGLDEETRRTAANAV